MLKIRGYHCPTTLIQAVNLLAEDGLTVIAGGTDLLVNPRYMVGVREVVDIRNLGLDYIGYTLVLEPQCVQLAGIRKYRR